MTWHVLKIVWNRKRANALIVSEIFLSFLVLFAVLTLISAIAGSVGRPLGFEWRDVWNVSVESDAGDLGKPPDESQRQSIVMLMRELRSMPQIMAVAGSDTPPYSMSANEGNWLIEGKDIRVTQDRVTDDFAAVMQLPVIGGRWFAPEDEAANFSPVVVDADLARAIYGNENAVGRKFDGGDDTEVRIIGVVAPYRKTGEFANFGKPVNMMFRHATPGKSTLPENLLIRLQPGTPASFEKTLNDRLSQIAPQMQFRIRKMSSMRQLMRRLAIFPLTALVMVALFLILMVVLGLSGVLWQNVSRRRREIGLRRAIGATGPAVQRQIVAEVAMLTTLAVIFGVVIVMQLPLLGIFTLITPAAFTGGLAASLAAIYGLTILCGLYPGWLASRVQPAQALHYE